MLSETDVRFYQENGYLAAQDFFDQGTIKRLGQALERLTAKAKGMTGHDEFYDLEDSHTPENPRVRRIKKPINMDEAFFEASRSPQLLQALSALIGPDIRLSHPTGKVNVKASEYGAAVEWHQDWAAYPHTNDDLLTVGIPLDDCFDENGPLLVIPGSHRSPIYDHHADGVYCGGIDPVGSGIDFSKAVPLTGRAGMVTFHHTRTVHGSAMNRSKHPRRLFLIQYAAVDAWPILGVKDWDKFNQAIVTGQPTFEPRMEAVPVRIPYPEPPFHGSLYEHQRVMARRHFETSEPQKVSS